MEFLRSVLPPTTDPGFFQFLRELDCSGVTLRSVPEGTVVFARVTCSLTDMLGCERVRWGNRSSCLQVPLMEVEGPLAVVQLLETSLLCLTNYAR